jgi:hypothetical protein
MWLLMLTLCINYCYCWWFEGYHLRRSQALNEGGEKMEQMMSELHIDVLKTVLKLH